MGVPGKAGPAVPKASQQTDSELEISELGPLLPGRAGWDEEGFCPLTRQAAWFTGKNSSWEPETLGPDSNPAMSLCLGEPHLSKWK